VHARTHARTRPDLYLRAARINEKNLGSQHPELAENFNALGLVFKIRGKMAEAEEYVRKAIAIIRAVYGDEHQKLALFINNLADVLSITAKYDEAKQLYAQAMAINTKCLGADHPEVSENLNSLGMIAKKVRWACLQPRQ
jgi:tetratricopeptide (TPR) repeat protein